MPWKVVLGDQRNLLQCNSIDLIVDSSFCFLYAIQNDPREAAPFICTQLHQHPSVEKSGPVHLQLPWHPWEGLPVLRSPSASRIEGRKTQVANSNDTS